MKYNFDLKCDRANTNCVKWDAVKDIFGREDVIPMWVADMDFPAAKPIVAALKKRAAHEFYGYTKPGPELIEAIVNRMQRKFDWQIRPEWIVFTPGVIPALSAAVEAVPYKTWLVAGILLAVLVQIVLVVGSPAIAPDGVTFVAMALIRAVSVA